MTGQRLPLLVSLSLVVFGLLASSLAMAVPEGPDGHDARTAGVLAVLRADDTRGTEAGSPRVSFPGEGVARVEVPWLYGEAAYDRTVVLLLDEGRWRIVSDSAVLSGLAVPAKAEGDTQDESRAEWHYETPAETRARERRRPVGQYESQQKAELVAAVVLYLEREYGVGQGLFHTYRLAVVPIGEAGGGVVDVEWYLGGEHVGTTFLRFGNSTVAGLISARGYDPREP